MAGGSTAHRADIQNSYSGYLQHSDPSSLRKENGHRQPLPTNHSCCLIWGAYLCFSMTSNFCIRRRWKRVAGEFPEIYHNFKQKHGQSFSLSFLFSSFLFLLLPTVIPPHMPVFLGKGLMLQHFSP